MPTTLASSMRCKTFSSSLFCLLGSLQAWAARAFPCRYYAYYAGFKHGLQELLPVAILPILPIRLASGMGCNSFPLPLLCLLRWLQAWAARAALHHYYAYYAGFKHGLQDTVSIATMPIRLASSMDCKSVSLQLRCLLRWLQAWA